MRSITKDPPQSIKLGGGVEMKTIAEEPVQQTGECCGCRNSHANTTNHCTTYHPCIIAGADGTPTCHGTIGISNSTHISVPDNQISLTVTSPPTGDSVTKTCGECNVATGVTATITTRKKVNNNNNINDNSRRQRYIVIFYTYQR